MTYSLTLVDKSNVLGQIHTNAHPKHFGLYFTCAHTIDSIDSSIFHVFKNAIEGNAHHDIHANPDCSYHLGGGIGNKRGNLSECQCRYLNRVTYPKVRRSYENQVINTIFDLLKIAEHPEFSLKLVISSSGKLLGEEILLFRLIDQLKRHKASGNIHLFLIDSNYEFNQGGRPPEYIMQFLKEICHCLPSTIKLQGTFFSSVDNYLQMATSDRFQHHLAIGIDIPDSISKARATKSADPIKLSRFEEKTSCELISSGKFEDFHKAHDEVLAFRAVNTTAEKPKDNTLVYVTVGGLLIGVAIAAGLFSRHAFQGR